MSDKNDSKTTTKTTKQDGVTTTRKEKLYKSKRLTAAEVKAARESREYEEKRAKVVSERPKGPAGTSIKVATAPGAKGQPRKSLIVAGLRFTPEPREVDLGEVTRKQYDAIMAHRLLEVEGKASDKVEFKSTEVR